jgi:oxygen-independent coproporphyrinogen III oxidase
MQQVSLELLNKYNVAIPRYTSYPTVPFWDDTIDGEHWKTMFARRFKESNEQEGISLYIHLPFCEKLCTFCGCNKRITTNHSVEEEYINVLLQEWNLYRRSMNSKPVIRELHIGGGTPTFFSPKNLQRLLQGILAHSIVPEDHEFGFEGHPNNTTREHLQTLFELGFKRVSFGMQDSNPQVQEVINRIQPIENVIQVVEWAREVGYESVNLDLVYGLPLQTLARIEKTIQDAIAIRPDRIAFYSYAHVPWTSKAQRLFDESDLPEASEKMHLYQKGKELFRAAGYTDIGMDHFALPTDLMVKAHEEGTLHRNFMGYTVQQTGLLLGLGVSSISDIYYGFGQNKKTIQEYYQQINAGELAVFKGYFLSLMDQKMRQYILDIACQGKTHFRKEDLEVLRQYTFHELDELAIDDLVTWGEHGVIVTDLGKHFIRNVCKAFDLKLLSSEVQERVFSQAV